MAPAIKTKKMVVKISRHPYINAGVDQDRILEQRVRKCRVHVERLSCRPSPVKPKRKHCIVRIARLPNLDRSDISATPASSIVCSDLDCEVSSTTD
ncbi:uncharacterized protein LOC115632812 [Scaptodrosophila lebanonensis]|uniref:Uncharacterized protein LOC115632812 n=1 Tax=Drosophila lebanonensis TaxID=7225 RepID=A0A6J2UET1_DROLE|nr:uncharacterized protein LOC115632812 [Scaptodrosophila lebanonensis]